MSITLVIFVHCLVNSFDASGLDPEEVPTIQQKKDGIIKSLVQIGIPMFFYISGIGSTFFKTEEKNFGIFVGDKVLRLLIPFVIAIFVFLIPRLYFGQQYEDFTRPDDQIESNYWNYMQKTLPTIHLKLSWLWYLPALFIDCMLTYPLLRWSIRRSKGIPFDPLVDTGIVLHQIITLGIWCLPCYYLVTKDQYGEIYLVPSIICLGCIMFCFYTFQLAIGTKNGHHYAMYMKLVGPLGSAALNYFKVQTSNQNLYHIFLMINYDAVFFSQGVIDMCYWKNMLKKRGEMAETVWAPIAVVGFLLVYSITSPMVYANMGHLFFYPLYGVYSLQCIYTTGTWLWLYTIVWIMAKIANDKFNPTIYNILCGSSLYAYVSHYFWILILSVGIIRPYKIGFVGAFCIMFFGTEFIIFATYIPLNFIYELIVPPKPTKKMDVDSVVDKSDIKAMEDAQKAEQEALAAAKADKIEGRGDGALDLENEFSDKKSGASR
jgi:hypothetical protein